MTRFADTRRNAMNLARMDTQRRPATFEYRALMALGFTIFLAVEIVSRLTRGGAGRRSILAEARAAARRTVPLAFMG